MKFGIKSGADPIISAKKFGFYTILIFILNVLLNYVQTSVEPFWDLTLRAVISGAVIAALNYLKHLDN